jgi:hypothetical protein
MQLRREDGLFVRSRPNVSMMMSLPSAALMVGTFQPEPMVAQHRSPETSRRRVHGRLERTR